ncbi:MAG: hypothetical protein WC809_14610 [Sinimarinibacterium sp.]|jgi:hypothetical protein
MGRILSLLVASSLFFGLSACIGKGERDQGGNAPPQCTDQLDNDSDGLTDFPADPGCANATDTDETDPPPAPVCSDGLDNDGDGQADFPADPGCSATSDGDETDPPAPSACSDQADNDSDGLTDFPADPGCSSASDTDEADPVALPACADGADNDSDGLTDFPADPGCESAADTDEANPVQAATRTRYAMASTTNGQCWALKANGTGNYVVRNSTTYAATATDIANAEPFYLKPTALGKYAFYNRNRQLMTATAPTLGHVASAEATDAAEWTVVGVGDTTAYPPTPAIDQEPTPEQVAAYHDFVDPDLAFSAFTIASAVDAHVAVDSGTGALALVTSGSNPANESFSFEPLTGCSEYPEASSNFSGTPFKGTQSDGTVLGHADVHVHISATTFLGGAHWGSPYHKFGVEHALGDCSVQHGPSGQLDLLGGVYTQDPDGHATDGWPTFTEWPSRGNLTHEAIYWKWLERAWAGGLRVVVNDLVDNETLCELQRNAINEPTRDCNSMNTAGQQVGTMYGMQDYIDAQYGGRGKGFFQIVHDADEGRSVIEDGHIAVVLGIEISEVFNCKLNYNPLRTQHPYDEDGSGGTENSYTCTMEEGQPNSILTQMQRIHDWGVRQVISIHEFDNAFGGNGIFDGLILNLGNREDTGGIPSGDIATLTSQITGDFNPELFQAFVENLPASETPTGEWWTTYDCPVEDSTPGFSGYLWGSSGGSAQSYLSPPLCMPLGQDGRSGGPTPCYPSGVAQCNARWMTPIGQYAYGKMMEMGFILDWDHMEMGMKTQFLELTEAQDPVYPIVSTHGTFGGTTVDQATRLLRDGGYLYPSNGSSRGFRDDMDETAQIYEAAMAGREPAQRLLFGFGYGTDTNGLSAQSGPRGEFDEDKAVVYPFVLFGGEPFDSLSNFDGISPVSFAQPSSNDADGNVKRTWHEDIDGNAHYGLLSDYIQEVRLEGNADHIKHLYNSAEVYLQTWQRTQAASAAIQAHGLKAPPATMLRAAPPVGDFAP